MNIVYVIEDYSENGGVERIVSMKANTFYQEYHYQVTVISVYEDKRKQQYILNEGIRLIHLHVPFAKKTRNKVYKLLSRIITLLLAAYRLNKTIKQINPDVVFFTSLSYQGKTNIRITFGTFIQSFSRTIRINGKKS